MFINIKTDYSCNLELRLRLRNHLFRQEFTNNNEIEKIF